MGKHSRRSHTAARRVATVSALSVSAVAAFGAQAQAATVVIPNTDIKLEIQGLENIPNIANVPGIAQYVPELAGQAAPISFEAVQEAVAISDGEAIVNAAESKIGSPYVWGAAGPNAFDCSGLTSWAYSQVGKAIPRTSYAQAAQGTPVSYNDLRAGDIIAFYSGASHVGIYSGHGTVIHAINESRPLAETSLDYMPFHSAVRF